MLKYFRFLCIMILVLFLRCTVASGISDDIKAVRVDNITGSSAQISWKTDQPATTQVVLVDSLYQPERRVPEPKEGSLTTSHEVVLQSLIPGTKYWYYVVSEDPAGRTVSTYNIKDRAVFETPPVNASLPFDYRLDAYGPENVYAGSDLYFGIKAVTLNGKASHYYLQDVNRLPPDITYHLICSARVFNSDETKDYYVSPSDKRMYCWFDGRSGVYDLAIRLRTRADTVPGRYTVLVTLESGKIQRSATYIFNVLSAPQPATKVLVKEIPPIPNLKKWEDVMITLAEKWHKPGEKMSFGWEGQIWYYDGGKTYFQIADYTKDFYKWDQCALNIVDQYRDYIIYNNGKCPGWRVFTQGLAMNYRRTGDQKSKEAVILLSNNSAFAKSGGGIDPALIRETSYMVQAYVRAEQLGEKRNPILSRAVDYLLGHFDMLFASDTHRFNQPFFDGLAAKALIDYYELTKDSRIPPAIKQMLDWLWDNAWDENKHRMAYNTLLVPVKYISDLNNLIAPAYAWYWQLTGDDLYLRRGDEIFSHALDSDISYSGKIFNQNYYWSFDYIKWRSAKK